MKTPVSVTDVTVTNIKPLEKAEHVKSIKPTFLDLILGDCYFPTLYLYRLPSNSHDEYQRFAARLKTSLGKVLVPFFPYAGRWVPDGGLWTPGRRGGFLLDCSNEGVPFIEAYVDENIDSVVRAGGGFEEVTELNGYEALGLAPASLKQKMRPEGLPPIFVQLTRFRCGGVALAVTFYHLHCDAEAFFKFMTSWAEVARTGQITVVPRVDRELAVSFEELVSQLNEDQFPILRDMVRMHSPIGRTPRPKKCIMRLYEVNATTVKNLKESALASPGGQYVSTNDCILAQLWKLTASLPPSMHDETPCVVLHAAEGRDRFYKYPMDHMLGNVYFTTTCPMPPSSELLEQPSHALAKRIRTDLLQTDWKNLFSMESLTAMLHGFAGEHVKIWYNTSWSKFGVYDLDFGFGAPYFSPGINLSYDSGLLGVTFVTPPAPTHTNSAASVMFLCSQEQLNFIEALPDFCNFFLPWEQ